MKPIAVTLGDPAGIGSEVTFRALAEIDPGIRLRLYGDWEYALRSPVPPPERITKVRHGEPVPDDDLVFIDLGTSEGRELRFGTVDAHYGRTALRSIEAALDALERGECPALVTGPVHKQALMAAGSPHPGHTDLLAARAGLKDYGREYAMMFDSPRLRVALMSVHVSLVEAIRIASPERVRDLALLVDREHLRLFGSRPRIAAAGVNPHAGEGGWFGKEDDRIAAGVELARREGVTIAGPFAPDTVFYRAAGGRWDVVLCPYHDQGLIAVKTLDFERSVNLTIGLPWLRCSVDHGTAFDIAGRGIADAAPMRFVIEWAAHHAGRAA
ncbi:MAG TPA: 4-hydroxythreonine-4-phosphate dehydrogenase PdxA [Thermoanaerobaculia bacterium]|nr:4-hydroxythreonine-4-phosphate dehydrogenase PdxA [Thermoanaerobaculia bacterium]